MIDPRRPRARGRDLGPEPGGGAGARAGDRPYAVLGVRVDDAGEHAEAAAAEVFGDVLHLDRVAQVGLVRAVLLDGRAEGDAREGAGSDGAGARELLEHAAHDGLDGAEHVLLRDEAHLKVELVELAGRAVGAGVLVAEAGGDLEVAVEA